MRNKLWLCLALALLFSGVPRGTAQDNANPGVSANKTAPEAAHFFRLQFLVKEIGDDGKVLNTRAYSTMCTTGRSGRSGSIRTGSRIPIYTGEKHEVQYVDLGVNIDIQNVHPVESQIGMDVTAEVSSVANQTPDASQTPVIRQNRWEAAVLIPLDRPSIIFSSDDLNSKGKIQVELTATPMK